MLSIRLLTDFTPVSQLYGACLVRSSEVQFQPIQVKSSTLVAAIRSRFYATDSMATRLVQRCARRGLLRPTQQRWSVFQVPQRALAGDRDVEKLESEKSKTENEFVALLRRIADAVEADKSFRVQVDGVRLTVPETAKVSVEHEQNGDDHEIELQFKWTSK